jgi:hypothetical protein
MGKQAAEFLLWQGGEQVVLAGIMRAVHESSSRYLSQLKLLPTECSNSQ